jgi:hypothetical protein
MSQPYTDQRFAGSAARAAPHLYDDHRLECLICRLPEHRQGHVRWLRSPAARWVRLPLGAFFILGGLLFILPVFGLWMLPVGLLLLAEDIPALRRLRTRALDWLERHRPHWFSEHHARLPHQRLTNKEETT